MKDIADLQHKIDCRYSWIKTIEERLPYADGAAYHQDKNRMSVYWQEIKNLERELKECSDDKSSG